MPTIHLKRKKDWYGRPDIIYVLVDRIRKGELLDGGAIDIEVPEGQHLLQIESSDGVYTSPIRKIMARKGQDMHFTVRYPLYFKQIVFAGMGLIIIHAILQYLFHIEVFFLLLLTTIPTLFIIYYITVGRFRALRLIPADQVTEASVGEPAAPITR